MDLVGAQSMRWDASFLWGKWLLLVAPRLDSSEVLYNATYCFVAGCVAQRHRTDRNIQIARRRYGDALTSLQHTLMSKDKNLALSSETIAATKLLSSFEVSSSNESVKSADGSVVYDGLQVRLVDIA